MAHQPDDDGPGREALPDLTHLDAKGAARMVDVGDKPRSLRTATAQALVELGADQLGLDLRDRFFGGGLKKGDGPAVARIAGIQAAKDTARLIPLCHPLALAAVAVELEPDAAPGVVAIRAVVRTTGPTGVEMEALCAASLAALAVYDMCKAVRRDIRIASVELLEKTGGVRGDWRRGQRPG